MNLSRAGQIRLTRLSKHALNALVYLAEQESSRYISADVIADARGIPHPTLKRIVLKPLVTAGLLLSIKGPSGGYRLAKPAKDISLLAIVEAVDGPIQSDAMPIGAETTARLDVRLQAICDKATSLVRENLAKEKLLELAKKR